MNEVSYKALAQAVERLRKALVLFEAHRDDEFTVSMRDSVLLSFQFTYGLCRPMIERFLVASGEDPQSVQELSLAATIRTAHERGLLRAGWAAWSEFRYARSRMAHVYSEAVSEGILAKVPAFLDEVSFLYEQLASRSEGL